MQANEAPKMRVPLGFPSSPMMTTAFVSKRTVEPSCRRVGNFVRTTMALTLSPDLISLPGSAFFTEQTTLSPTPAVFRVYRPRAVEPPSTRIT